MAFTSDGRAVERWVAGLRSWLRVREITFISETVRRGYKCCPSSSRQRLRSLSRGGCLRITLSRRWRDKPACGGGHQSWLYPAVLLSYRVKSSLRHSYSASKAARDVSRTYLGASLLLGGAGGTIHTKVIKRYFYLIPKCSKTTRWHALHKWYILYKFPSSVVHSAAVGCLLLPPAEL